jgi:hypothetical protein
MCKQLLTALAVIIALIAVALAPIVLYKPKQHEVQKVADNVWNKQFEFMYNNLVPLSSRIVAVRNPDTNEIIIYNPVPGVSNFSTYGTIKYLIVGNADHISFIPDAIREFGKNPPVMLVPPGLKKTLLPTVTAQNLTVDMRELDENSLKDFPQLEWKKIYGFEFLNEVVIYHKPSKLALVTDGAVDTTDAEYPGYPFLPIKIIAYFTGVYKQLGVKTGFRGEIDDLALVRKSINEICDAWDIKGFIMAHGEPFIDQYAELFWRAAWMQRTQPKQ